MQRNTTSRTARTMISLIAALETCGYELICITLHKWGKSTESRNLLLLREKK